MIKAFVAVGPGLGVAVVLTAVAYLLQAVGPFAALGPMMVAMVLGLVTRVVTGVPPALSPGLAFCTRTLLRTAIVLLGVRITFADAVAMDWSGLAVIGGALIVTFGATVLLARPFGVAAPLAGLLAAGVSICGASAVLAAASVMRAQDADAAYAVAAVTVMGTVAMLSYPLLAGPLGLEPRQYGLWAGASLHEVAQVLAAGFHFGDVSGEVATVSKLARVLCLAPLVLVWRAVARRGGGEPVPFPWFILGFVSVVAINSTLGVPAALAGALSGLASLLLVLALGALGLMTDPGRLRRAGPRPLVLAGVATLIVSGVSLGAILTLT